MLAICPFLECNNVLMTTRHLLKFDFTRQNSVENKTKTTLHVIRPHKIGRAPRHNNVIPYQLFLGYLSSNKNAFFMFLVSMSKYQSQEY